LELEAARRARGAAKGAGAARLKGPSRRLKGQSNLLLHPPCVGCRINVLFAPLPLFAIFAGIDCLSFAVMVNHVHVILRNRPDVVAGWSDEEVAKRWWQLFPLRKNKDKTPAVPTESELKMWMTPARSKRRF